MSSLARRAMKMAVLHPSLRDDVRSALIASQTRTEKKASLDSRTLDQLVEMSAESMGYDMGEAEATRDVEQAAKKFTKDVSKALSLWTQKHPPKNGSTVSDLMRAEAAYAIYMTLDGAGVGIWDGRWREFYDDTRKLEQFLERALSRSFQALKQAIDDAAWETAGGGED